MSVTSIRKRTAEKLAQQDDAAINDELRCRTPGCPNRWTARFSRGALCGPCDARMARLEEQTTPPLPFKRDAAGAPPVQPRPAEPDDGPLPF